MDALNDPAYVGLQGAPRPGFGASHSTADFDPAAWHGPSYLLDAVGVAEPSLGDKLGPLRIVTFTPYMMELRASQLLASLFLLGGVALSALIVFGIVLSVLDLVRHNPNPANGERFAIFFPLAAGALLVGLMRLGLRYTLDGRTRTVRRSRTIGGEKVWEARDLDHLRLIIVPAKKGSGEILAVVFVGRDGKDWEGKDLNGGEDPPGSISGGTNPRLPEGAVTARAAVAAARILGLPVRVQGSSVRGTEQFKCLVSGRGR